MAQPRKLRFVIEAEDEGGPDDYTTLINGLSSYGEIVEEEEIQ